MSPATVEPSRPAFRSTPGSLAVSVALVGAGPRGTSVLERLCASAPQLLCPRARLTVHVVDPAPPGPGQVWRTSQSPRLLMNTVSSQVTLFTDDSVDCSGPVRPGPSLYEWARGEGNEVGEGEGELGPDDYPTRAQYGRYLEWVFAKVVREAPPAVRVVTHPTRAVRLDDAPDGSQTLTLGNGRICPPCPPSFSPRATSPSFRTANSNASPRTPQAPPVPSPARQPGRPRPLPAGPRRTGPAARPRPELLRPSDPPDHGPRRPFRARHPQLR